MVGAFPFKNFLDDFYEHFVLVDKGNGKKKILIFEIAAEPKRHMKKENLNVFGCLIMDVRLQVEFHDWGCERKAMNLVSLYVWLNGILLM